MLLEEGISFISNNTKRDVLIVPYLLKTQNEDGKNNLLKILMVSGIDGDALNSENNEIKTESLLQLSSTTIFLELPAYLNEKNEHDIQLRGASCANETMIRFVVATKEGQMCLYDYNIADRDTSTLKNIHHITLFDESIGDERWTVGLDNAGIQTDDENSNYLVMTLAANSTNGRIKIFWIDFLCCSVLSEFELGSAHDNSIIHCICPLQSALDNSTAVAIALQKTSNEKEVYVLIVQCTYSVEVIEPSNTNDMIGSLFEKVTIMNPHVVFRIPVCIELNKVKIPRSENNTVHLYPSSNEEYGFSLAVEVQNSIQYWSFEAGSNKSVGYIKGINACYNSEGQDAPKKFSHYYESIGKYESAYQIESSLWSFKNMMNKEKILTRETKDEVREIFRSLTTGAVTGGLHGLQNLLEASEALRDWPRRSAGTKHDGPQLRDFYLVLNAMKINVANAMKGASQQHLGLLNNEVKCLDAKISCVKCLETVLKIGKKEEIPIGFLGQFDNVVQLYRHMLSKGTFEVAECVRKFDEGKNIGSKQLSLAIECLSVDMYPRSYCHWLEEIVIPILIFNQEQLDPLKKWCCKAADYYDRDGCWDIDGSVVLLETVSNAIANATVDKHMSFATHPSVGRQKRNEKQPSCSGIIETKLQHARILKQARDLGLPSSHISLQTFVSNGGADFITKDLVRLSCELYGVDNFSISPIKEKLRMFCDDVGVSFDQAIAKYAEDLCDTKKKVQDLDVSSKLTRLCSDLKIKCQVALKVLRAAQFSTNPTTFRFRPFTVEALEWARDDTMREELQEVSRLLVIDDIVTRYCGKKATGFFRVHEPLHSSNLLNHVCRFIDSPTQIEDVMFLCDSFTHLSRVDSILRVLQKVSLASPQILNNSQTRSRAEQCRIIMEYLSSADLRVAISVAMKYFTYSDEILQSLCRQKNHFSKDRSTLYQNICSASINIGVSVISALCGETEVSYSSSLLRLKHHTATLKRMQQINDAFSIFVSYQDFECGHRIQSTAISIIENVIDSWHKLEDQLELDFSTFFKRARRGISILCSDKPSVFNSQWCKAVANVASTESRKGNEKLCLQILEASGILNKIQDESAFKAVISIVTSLCPDSIDNGPISQQGLLRSMQSFFLAASLLQEHVLKLCPSNLLPTVVFLNNATYLVSEIILQTDCGLGEKLREFRHYLCEKSKARQLGSQGTQVGKFDQPRFTGKSVSSLHPDWYVGDGLLLPPAEAMSHSMKFLKEVLVQSSLLQQANDPSCINRLFQFLHSHGALSISLKTQAFTCTVILTSIQQRCNAHGIVSTFSQITHDVVRCLTERYLASSGSGNTNGNIDSDLAVHHLLSLPIKLAFKVSQRVLLSIIIDMICY